MLSESEVLRIYRDTISYLEELDNLNNSGNIKDRDMIYRAELIATIKVLKYILQIK